MMDVSRHRSVDTLRGYVRDAELFRRRHVHQASVRRSTDPRLSWKIRDRLLASVMDSTPREVLQDQGWGWKLREHLKGCGFAYLCTDSVDVAIEWLKAHGVLRGGFTVQ